MSKLRMSQAQKIQIAELINRDYRWFDPSDSVNQKRVRNAISIYEMILNGEKDIQKVNNGRLIYRVPSSGWYDDSPESYEVGDLNGCPTCTCGDWHKAAMKQKGSPVVLMTCKHVILIWLMTHLSEVSHIVDIVGFSRGGQHAPAPSR